MCCNSFFRVWILNRIDISELGFRFGLRIQGIGLGIWVFFSSLCMFNLICPFFFVKENKYLREKYLFDWLYLKIWVNLGFLWSCLFWTHFVFIVLLFCSSKERPTLGWVLNLLSLISIIINCVMSLCVICNWYEIWWVTVNSSIDLVM